MRIQSKQNQFCSHSVPHSSGWEGLQLWNGVREKCFEVPPSAASARPALRVLDYRAKSSARLEQKEGKASRKAIFLHREKGREKRSRDSGGQKGGKIKAHLKRRGGKKEIDWIRHWTRTRTQIRRKKAAVGVGLSARRCVEMTHEREREIATTDRKGERPQRSSIRETNT